MESPPLQSPPGQADGSFASPVSITQSPSKAWAPLWGQGHGLLGSPLTSQDTRLCLESPWAVIINKENCKPSTQCEQVTKPRAWVGFWNHRGWILSAVPSVHISLSTFIFWKIRHLYPLVFTSLTTESLLEERITTLGQQGLSLSQLINAAQFEELLTQRKFLMWLCACRSKTQSKSSHPWHQDTLAKTILINYNYNCMLNKLQLGCLMYQLIILGM